MARARGSRGSRKAADNRDRAILVGVTTTTVTEARESIDELRELAISGGLVVLDEMVQKREKLDPKTLVGKGKLDEIIILSLQLGADMIVFDCELSPSQVRAINAATDFDTRPFATHPGYLRSARSNERRQDSGGTCPVKVSSSKTHRVGIEMSRLMGGIGGRGPGETKLEVDRRRVRERISQLKGALKRIRASRQQRRARRQRRDLPVVSIVGYTNAGKSTLLNSLTQSSVSAEERMFATLDPTSRRLRLPRDTQIIINDTVGFIRNLPQDLLAAFKATLEEIEQSDLLIHLVDGSSPNLESQIKSVEQILG